MSVGPMLAELFLFVSLTMVLFIIAVSVGRGLAGLICWWVERR